MIPTALEQRIKNELRILLQEMASGCQPSNSALYDAVVFVLGRQQQIADNLKAATALEA
jgi:hypothetical protein